MADMKGTLTKKIGPLPLYTWVGIAAVIGGLIYLYLKNRSASSSTTASTSTTAAGTGSSTLTGVVPTIDNFYSGGGVTPPPPTVTPVVTGHNSDHDPTHGHGPGDGIGPVPAGGGGGQTPSPNPIKQGGGYWYGLGNYQPVQGTDKRWYMWESPQTASEDPSIKRYVWTGLPNVFAPVTGPLLPGTPQFLVTGPPSAPVAGSNDTGNGINVQPTTYQPQNASVLNGNNPASAIAPSALQRVG